MLAILSIIIGLAGFSWAGWRDLKTTEFPDWLPYSLILSALGLRAAFSFMWGDWSLLFSSLLVGGLFLGFGLLLYFLKQWGDGDAWLLGAMGFLYPDGLGFPSSQLPFPFVLLFNFFFMAFGYILVYSLVLGLRSDKKHLFAHSLKGSLPRITGVTVLFTIAIIGLLIALPLAGERQPLLWASPIGLFFLLIFLQYGKFIEGSLFKRKIPVNKLQEGDVPATEKWRVLSKKEIQVLRKRGGTIWIKEGVRFAPVFALTVLSLMLGSIWGVLF